MADAILALARTLHIGSALLLAGMPFFILVSARPLAGGDSYAALRRTGWRWMGVALVVEGMSGLIWFWWVTARMGDESPFGPIPWADVKAALLETGFGELWLGRLAVGAGLTAGLFLWSRGKAEAGGWVLAFGGLLLASLAWAGHARSGTHFHALHLIADVLHLLLGAVWPGGLFPLGWLLWRHGPALNSPEGLRMLKRFSRLSGIAVGILAITGFINGWLMLGAWMPLVTSAYGRLLLAKVLVVGWMIGLGAINRFSLLPKASRRMGDFRALGRTIWAESILAFVVIIIVGVMGMTAPPG